MGRTAYRRRQQEFALRPATWGDLQLLRSSKYDEALDFLAMGLSLVAELPEDPDRRRREIARLMRGLRRRARQRGATSSIHALVVGRKLFISTQPMRMPRPSRLALRPALAEDIPLDLKQPLRFDRLREELKKARREAWALGQAWAGLVWKVRREEAEVLAKRLRSAVYKLVGEPREGVIVRVLVSGDEIVLLWRVGEPEDGAYPAR